MTTYYLAGHVHSCLTNGHIVFLDLRQDRYSALPPGISKALSALVTNRALNLQELGQPAPDIEEAIKNLLDRGILTPIASAEAGIPTRTAPRPQRDLSEADIEGRHRIRFIHVANFLYAYVRAIIGTRLLGIQRLISSLANKRPHGKRPVPRYPLDEVVQALRFIRIFFYKEIDHCYFDCAVHMYFLRRYGFDPVWVFGVKMDPFHAHCWVQVDDTLVTNFLGETGMLQTIVAI